MGRRGRLMLQLNHDSGNCSSSMLPTHAQRPKTIRPHCLADNIGLEKVKYLDYVVSHEHLIESCAELLTLVFPSWNISHDVEFVQCKDGITNKLVKCFNRVVGQTLLVRAYGKKSELIIDRLAELTVGLSPPLYARFKNGFVYGYIQGQPFTVPDMSDTKKASLVARKIATWHKVHLPGGEEARLFPTLWKWYGGIPTFYNVPETQAKFESNVDLNYLKSELHKLEAILKKLDSPVVFCHNDLLSGNIIFEPDKDDVSFIDFEYGCNNYRGFDLGNHFCEFAGFDCDYSRYPTKDQQLPWLTSYFEQFYGRIPSPKELEQLYLEVNLFGLSAHFYWGLWGLVQAAFSDIPFDYMSYALLRFRQFEKTKDYWFSFVE